jgi:hypothetical protein
MCDTSPKRERGKPPNAPIVASPRWRSGLVIAALCISALAGCGPAGGRLPPPARQPPAAVTPVGYAPATSCGAAACHGRPFDGKERDWQNACAVFEREDPHRYAFAVLYTTRSLEMYRNLHPDTKLAAVPPEEKAYFAFLRERCVGCHATPQAQQSPAPEDFAWGVSCQSCHGPAATWLHTHYLYSFPPPGRTAVRERLRASGFYDTKDLRTRANLCVECHVGPKVVADVAYEVSHDLIAAGHPRLIFELDAYLANYPPHWDVAGSERLYRQITRSPSFHFDAWRLGQQESARMLLLQLRPRASGAEATGNEPLDFARYDCVDCHHALADHGSPRFQTARAAGQLGLPRPEIGALQRAAIVELVKGGASGPPFADEVARLPAILAGFQDSADLTALVASLDRRLASPEPSGAATVPRHWSWAERALVLKRMLAAVQRSGDAADRPTWDEARELYLALAATARDEPESPPSKALQAAAEALRAKLDTPVHFGGVHPLSQYDFPSRFDPAQLAPALARVAEALDRAGQTDGGAAP